MSPSGNAAPTVSVGIAAFNAEANISDLLRSLLSQSEQHVAILEIIVHSDCSSDRTVALAQDFGDARIRVIDRPTRGGFAQAVISLLGAFRGDALVLLNDDIKLADSRVIEALSLAALQTGVGLVGANMQPLPPRTFVEGASVSVFRVWERIREWMPDAGSVFTCDGAALCLSASFARSLKFPVDRGQMGNVDAFLYFACLSTGFRYVFAREAVVYVRSPATVRDYMRRNIRNDSQQPLLERQFGPIVARAFRIPRHLYWKAVARELFANPLGSVFIFAMGFYIRLKAPQAARNSSATWEVVKSSKELR